MDRTDMRAGMTELAQQQGVEVLPGQLEAAGIWEDEAEATNEAPAGLQSGEGKYWRVRISAPAIKDEAHAPDHVVRALDKANAWEAFKREYGVIETDRNVNRVDISSATEADFIRAQAKRLRVDLREHRITQKDGRKMTPRHPDYGTLTWDPPGGKIGKYKVTDKGELIEVNQESEAGDATPSGQEQESSLDEHKTRDRRGKAAKASGSDRAA